MRGLAVLGGGGMFIALAAGLMLRPPALAAPPQDPNLAARTKGAPDAPITIYEVADFQCPACRTFWAQTLPSLEQEYLATGKARLTFINMPLVSIHPNAPAAHEVAMCAAQQNRFWPMHDLLYRHQDRWAGLGDPRPFLLGLADSAGLAPAVLKACLESGVARGVMQQEAAQAYQAGVRSTPSFVIERSLLPGAAPIEAWRPILDSIYRVKTGGS